MAEVLPSSEKPAPHRVRFARVTGAIGFGFALAGLGYGQFSLIAAAIVCSGIALVSAALARDIYAAAGSLVAGVIAFTSPAATSTIVTIRAEHAAAKATESARVSDGLAEVEAYDAHVRGYQPDLGGLGRHSASYAALTGLMTQERDRYLLARSTGSPDQQSLANAITALSNRMEALHTEMTTGKVVLDRNIAAIPGKWSHIQTLCHSPEIDRNDACSRIKADYPPYRVRVSQVEEAFQRDEAAYSAAKPRQQDILASLL